MAQKELMTSEIEFRTLAESSPVGIFRTDCDGACIYVNKKWCELSGMSRQEAIGNGWVKAIHPDDKEKTFKEWSSSVAKGVDF
ncbi:MAG: PAS domain S-box protein [Bacteroidetes bacterium]|nr:MAG: PAS domain S-box protein [Bacteroidota bacterium]REK00933.1 MAG: PAS domain S-box protein [Bacteroidota bacterium]REK34536.1 MAG: PAS domain S-box protein [Bacteroidota bacterium]REK51794.1 MAG: PAS domain S-box protein [Bacteroidota bacterium]